MLTYIAVISLWIIFIAFLYQTRKHTKRRKEAFEYTTLILTTLTILLTTSIFLVNSQEQKSLNEATLNYLEQNNQLLQKILDAQYAD